MFKFIKEHKLKKEVNKHDGSYVDRWTATYIENEYVDYSMLMNQIKNFKNGGEK